MCQKVEKDKLEGQARRAGEKGRREGQAKSAGEKGRKGEQGASGLREVLAGILTGWVRRKRVGKMISLEREDIFGVNFQAFLRTPVN